ncbi:MAG: type II toxin-antitoxin system PemK/MazF family toxin [Candidatus Hydrogenedentes bacterium]|nr:type II toxin-antitoxin system PemK/MazF family toxin [Candidatus Hydrogenedentota bacterium]
MAARKQVSYPRRGEVYLVNFDPAVGAVIKKTRPALILQNDVGNKHGAVTIVAGITSTIPPYPHPVRVLIKSPEAGFKSDSVVLLDQIRTVDTSRLGKRIGALRPGTLEEVDKALRISLGLVKL